MMGKTFDWTPANEAPPIVDHDVCLS